MRLLMRLRSSCPSVSDKLFSGQGAELIVDRYNSATHEKALGSRAGDKNLTSAIEGEASYYVSRFRLPFTIFLMRCNQTTRQRLVIL